MVEDGDRIDAQQGEIATLGRHDDPTAAVMASLEGVERKLGWADKHFETLCSEIARVREENPYRIAYEPTTDPLGYKFFVHDLAPPDPDLGLMIGDCVHNLRACLDHLAYQLAILGKGGALDEREAKSVMCPIYPEPKGFRDYGKRRIKLLRPEVQVRMEELQPYNAGNSSVWGPFPYVPALLPTTFDYLNNLENIDKHRTVTPIWQVVDSRSTHPTWPACIGSAVRAGPLQDGGWLGDWTFNSEPPDISEVDLKDYFPLSITVGHPMTMGTATEVLDQLICAVDVVIHIFAPCFSEGTPPPLPLRDVYFHAGSAYSRRIGQFRYLRG